MLAIPALTRLLKDEDDLVRGAAAQPYTTSAPASRPRPTVSVRDRRSLKVTPNHPAGLARSHATFGTSKLMFVLLSAEAIGVFLQKTHSIVGLACLSIHLNRVAHVTGIESGAHWRYNGRERPENRMEPESRVLRSRKPVMPRVQVKLLDIMVMVVFAAIIFALYSYVAGMRVAPNRVHEAAIAVYVALLSVSAVAARAGRPK